MKHLFGQQLYWRDLDVRQVVYWPNAPRRWLLALLSVLLFAGLVALLVWPKLIQLRDEQARIQNAQNLIEQALRVPPNVLDQVPPIRIIHPNEEAIWLANLANTASQNNLSKVSLKVKGTPEEQRKQIQEDIQYSTQENARLFGRTATNAPMDWLKQTWVLNLSVQGSYPDILAFVTDLGKHDEWVAVRAVKLEAVGQQQVRWTADFWYLKEGNPNASQ